MAKKGKLMHSLKRTKLVEQHQKVRDELRATSKDINVSLDVRMDASRKLAALPKNSSKVRLRNRCGLTGRPRGYLRQFGLSRIAFRELALQGEIPGVIKASW